jgi:predicted transcriptional regulator
MRDLKSNLKFFGITHKEVALEVGIAQSAVTQLLDENLLRRVQLGAEALIDRKVSDSQAYQNQRLADITAKINPLTH